MGLSLRPYQQDLIDTLRKEMSSGVRRLLVCSPTGSGKTALTAKMLGVSAEKGLRSKFVVHRRELVKQSALAFFNADVPYGIVASQFNPDINQPVQICSIQTLANRYLAMPDPSLIVWDECHHVAAGTWKKIFHAYPRAFHVGLTATPERLDGKGLGDFFDKIIPGPNVKWLIENKYLSKYKLFAPTSVSFESVKTTMGDYNKVDLMNVMDVPKITGDAVREYKKTADGKRAVVFCVSVKHSQYVVNSFNAAGITAMHVDATTPAQLRDDAIKLFAEGKIQVLSNVDLFGEGFDLPSIEAVILLRPTKSLALYLQQVGRGLRPSPGKDHAIILDHVENYKQHGLPDDEREWSLLGKKYRKKNADSGPSLKICKNCYAAQPAATAKCVECGSPFDIKGREVSEVEGELEEIDTSSLKNERLKKQASAKTLEELIALGKSRGMKNPYGWAKHVFNARQAKKIGRVHG